jgi:N-acetylmuramoyl-L-alanine amidase
MGKPAWMDPTKITDITIHCAATPEGKPFTAAQISAMDQARTDLGNQTAYHYVIELDGKTTQTLRHDQRGAHTGGHNTGNLGISYVGGVLRDGKTPADTRTPAQTTALIALLKKLRGQYPGVRIRGHRDWPGVAKACPSFDVAVWLKSVGL